MVTATVRQLGRNTSNSNGRCHPSRTYWSRHAAVIPAVLS